MPTHALPIIMLLTTLENDTHFAEALFFPEVLRYSDCAVAAEESLKVNVEKTAEGMRPLAMHRRHPAGEPQIREIALSIQPGAERSKCWRTPVELRFQAAAWMHGDAAAVMYVPALGIELSAINPATIEAAAAMAPKHIRAELARRGALGSFELLTRLQRARHMTIGTDSIQLLLQTPKQIAARAEQQQEEKKSALAEAATDLGKEKLATAFEMDETVARLAETLTGRNPRSALLVGRSGVGKTAAIHELVRRRDAFQLAHTPFYATNGSRLVAGMSGFGQWQERCTRLWREAAGQRAVLYLGNLIELMEVGKYIGNTQGIADFLRPYIARGDVLAVAECTPEQASLIERVNPRLLDAFEQIKLEEPPPDRVRGVLLSYALSGHAEVQLEAVERMDQLHRRYATYSASPGRPLRFLKNLLLDAPDEVPISAEAVTDAFSRETGLPRVLLDEREPLDLGAAHDWFSARVIGQPEAVNLIVDLLATVKAELTRPRKPIASLLFIGPTGVGKTEMAKSLAEFLFRDRDRMTRFDMSEYADPIAVRRLIGGAFGAIGGPARGSEGLLTARVREQPFSVVLLDEFEKADPSFFDLLLQVLGEGRLTDSMGRVADFTNAVVILTSNLGAQSFQRGVSGFGEARATREAAARESASRHFTQAVRQALRPELFNRIDRIVPFAPLDEATVLAIAQRELELVRQRDGIRYRQVDLRIRDGVAQHLARRGYDVRYGARPLKRAIERELLAPLAEVLIQQPAGEDIEIHLSVEHEQLQFRVMTDAARANDSPLSIESSLAPFIVRAWPSLRRETQALDRSSAMRNLQNNLFALERLEKRIEKSKWKSPKDLDQLARLPMLRDLLNDIRTAGAAVVNEEETALLSLYARTPLRVSEQATRCSEAEAAWNRLLLRLHASNFKNPDSITLAVFGEEPRWLFELAQAYYAFAAGQNAAIVLHQFTLKPAPKSGAKTTGARKKKTTNESRYERTPIEEKPARYLDHPLQGVLCLALEIRFPNADPTLCLERGLHTFFHQKKPSRCVVDISEAPIGSYAPPAEMARQGAIGPQAKRRVYNLDTSLIEDARLDLRQPWSGRDLREQVRELVEKTLLEQIRMQLNG
jgi:ATP-dependent Clp protease ATP-binding subunit ClpA